MLHDDNQRYGSITRFFHWVIAVLVLQQFFKFADRINEGEHWLGDTFGPWHVSMGAIILILTIARLLWTMKQKPQRPTNPGMDGTMAKLAHRLMYLSMLVMPFLGALYSSLLFLIFLISFCIFISLSGDRPYYRGAISSLHPKRRCFKTHGRLKLRIKKPCRLSSARLFLI